MKIREEHSDADNFKIMESQINTFLDESKAEVAKKNKSNINQYNVVIDNRLPYWLCDNAKDLAGSLQSVAEDGVKFLFLNEQYYVQKNTVTKYVHSVKQMVNMAAVESLSKIFLEFNQSDSHLVIHQISIQRDGKILDKIPNADMQVLQREASAEANVFSGDLTLSIILDDVKPGDIIDLKYSHVYTNEAIAKNFNCLIHLKLIVSFYERTIYIISDQNVSLSHKLYGDFPVNQYAVNGRNILSLKLINTEKIVYLKYEPHWYKPDGLLQICVNSSWCEISKSTMNDFRSIDISNKKLLDLIDDLNGSEIPAKDAVIRVLNYIHNNIRYLANYKSTDPIIPSNPNMVVDRGYGDCKDLSYMMICILSKLGINCVAVLVNSRIGRGLDEYMSASALFNHVIVRVKIANKQYYIDPTLRQYASELEFLYMTNYGYGLICDEDTSELREIVNNDTRHNEIVIDDTYKIHSWKKNELTFSARVTFSGRFLFLIIQYLEKNPESKFFDILNEEYSKCFIIKKSLTSIIDRSLVHKGKITIIVSYDVSAKYLESSYSPGSLEAFAINLFGLFYFSAPKPEDIDSDFYFDEPRILKYTINFNDGNKRSLPYLEDTIIDDVFTYYNKRVVMGNKVSYYQEYKITNNVVKKEDYPEFYKSYSKVINSNIIKYECIPSCFLRIFQGLQILFVIAVCACTINHNDGFFNHFFNASNSVPSTNFHAIDDHAVIINESTANPKKDDFFSENYLSIKLIK